MRLGLGPRRLAVLVTASALFLAVVASPAMANHVQCGDVITQDTKLDSDVICTGTEFDPLVGIVIGADGVTLDLNGFSILGPNRGEQVEELQAGIATNGAYRSVTIKNGTIQGFSEGMVLDLAGSTLRGLTSFGRLTLRGDRNVVRDGFFSDGDTGMVIRGNDNRILRNYAFGNDDHGIDVSGARNSIIGNTAESFIATALAVHDFTDVVIRGNVASSGVGQGIEVRDGSGGVIERNVASENDSADGIFVLADNLLIRKNEASHNEGNGISVFGTGNTVKQNTANDNGNYGIFAVAGNIDGGGNRAQGNGNPAQCFGVSCR